MRWSQNECDTPDAASAPETVSVIVPTYGRHEYFPLLHRCFSSQDYANKEMLVYDDSPRRSSFFDRFPDVRYYHSPKRISIGEKRNFLISEAIGDVIAHFDDDDYYAPSYLRVMTGKLRRASVAKLSGWFLYDIEKNFFGYWDTAMNSQLSYILGAGEPLRFAQGAGWQPHFLYGYGFSYVYRKDLRSRGGFPKQNFGEDYHWIRAVVRENEVNLVQDHRGLAVHFIHTSNTSRAFPQYRLPPPLLKTLCGPDALRYLQPRSSATTDVVGSVKRA